MGAKRADTRFAPIFPLENGFARVFLRGTWSFRSALFQMAIRRGGHPTAALHRRGQLPF
jgi:hypothetical protein